MVYLPHFVGSNANEFMITSRIAVYIPVFLFSVLFCVINYFINCKENSSLQLPVVAYSNEFYNVILYLALFLILCIITFVILSIYVFFSSLFVKIYTGNSPFGNLTIIYKFEIQNSIKNSILEEIKRIYPYGRIIQMCYLNEKDGRMGLAYGVIVSSRGEKVSDSLRMRARQYGYRVMYTPKISHSVYMSCPSVPWLAPLCSWFYWISLCRIYPRFNNHITQRNVFCIAKYIVSIFKKHNLSAYPVIEVYGYFSVTLMAPLSRQDSFVVTEAEDMICRSPDDSKSSHHQMYNSTTSISTSKQSNILFTSKSMIMCNKQSYISYSH